MTRKSELYHWWEMQENLLQIYRAFGLAMQTLLLTSSLVVAVPLHESIGEMRGLLITHGIYLARYPNRGVSYVVLFVIFVLVIIVGIVSLFAFKRITARREGLVFLFQNLLIREERGVLSRELRHIGLRRELPLTCISRFCDLDPNDPKQRKRRSASFEFINVKAWKYFHDRFQNRDWEAPGGRLRGATRRYFSRTVYRHFTALWFAVGVFATIVLGNLLLG